jgi:hypothetical protein
MESMLEIIKNEYYNDGEAPERSVDVEIAIRLKEENKVKWRNMCTVIHIEESLFYTTLWIPGS